MLDSSFRRPYQKIALDPILPFLPPYPILFTAFGFVFGVFVPIALVFDSKYVALFFLGLSGYFDTLDGSLARYLSMSSDWGAVCDIVSDRAVEFFVVLGLYFVAPDFRALPCLILLGSILLCITSFLVVGIFTKNQSEKSFNYSPGWMERTEAFLFFFAMIAFPHAFVFLAYLMAGLIFTTAILRVVEFGHGQHLSRFESSFPDKAVLSWSGKLQKSTENPE